MFRNKFMKLSSVALAVAAITSTSAYAQENVSEQAGDLELEEIIVTGVFQAATRLETSVSVSAITAEKVERFAPRSTAELFRNLPGVRSEASSGIANTNIALRGIPISTGGAKYLQLHEDGLPVLEFGDMNFTPADGWIRYDYSVDSVQAIRGGSASTSNSNSPGGVINMISKTGEEKGGSVGLEVGLDYSSTRLNFEYGEPLENGWRYHIGGFYRSGEGPRETAFDTEKGGQIKANLTKEFDNGYVRAYLKRLDDRGITYLPAPFIATGTNSNPTFSPTANFDQSREQLFSDFNRRTPRTDSSGNLETADLQDGFTSDITAIGLETSIDFAEGWNVTNKFRTSSIEGGFTGLFIPGAGFGSAFASSTVGIQGDAVFANGPRAGQRIGDNEVVVQSLLLDMEIESNDLTVNDLKFTKELGNADLTFGLYKSIQDIVTDWKVWNFSLLEANGPDSATLNLIDANGVNQSDNGIYSYSLLPRVYDLEYDITAPYVNLGFSFDSFNFDISYRRDDGEARGFYVGPSTTRPADLNSDGSISVPEQNVAFIDGAPVTPLDYDWDYDSFSVGGTYLINNSSSVFARLSEGHRANADRLPFDGFTFNADGSVAQPDNLFDDVEQFEIGYKYQGDNFDLYVTYFDATTDEGNFDVTTGQLLVRRYEADGFEFEGSFDWGNFSIEGTLTLTDAEITRDAVTTAVVGGTPRRQADWVFTLTPAYTTDKYSVGVNLIGTDDAFAADEVVDGSSETLVMPGYIQANLFASWYINDQWTASVNVNNATDEFGFTEINQGSITNNTVNVLSGRSINGRSASATLKYEF